MFGTLTVVVVVAVAALLQVYLVTRVVRQERKIAEREDRIQALRSQLACADASMFRLNDKIAALQAAQSAPAGDAVVLFPEAALAEPIR